MNYSYQDVLETINMIQQEHLDIRTVTMGISLLSCIDSDIDKACRKVYDKITAYGENLVSVCEGIEKEFGIPIINKRISVTPIAMLAAACPGADPVCLQHSADSRRHSDVLSELPARQGIPGLQICRPEEFPAADRSAGYDARAGEYADYRGLENRRKPADRGHLRTAPE